MKVITFYSDSHKKIYENYFLNSYKEQLSRHKLITKKIDQISPSGEYESEGFDYVMLEKIKFIIESINILEDDLLVYSDCDVQFFGDIEFEMGDNDILFQNDYFEGNHCAGFFIAKQNEKVLDFFKEVEKKFTNNIDGKIHDQVIINRILSQGYDRINYSMLPPNKYWTVAFSTGGKPWNGQEITVPDDILVHHANFTVGIENKEFLLEKVKEFVKKRN